MTNQERIYLQIWKNESKEGHEVGHLLIYTISCKMLICEVGRKCKLCFLLRRWLKEMEKKALT